MFINKKKPRLLPLLVLLTLMLIFFGCRANPKEEAKPSEDPVIQEENVEKEDVSEISEDEPEEEPEEPEVSEEPEEPEAIVEESESQNPSEPVEGHMEITMLDVGQGLSILIGVDGEYMIYDGGGRESSSSVVTYLRSNGISSLKYLVASHYDEDHLAGLIGVLNTTSVGLALTPDYEAETSIYTSFKEKIQQKHVEEVHPGRGESYELGNATVQVLGPDAYSTSEDNNNSIIIRVVFGDFSCLMTGDAEEIEEYGLMNSKQDIASSVYVVGHHGSSSSTGYDFLQKVNPKIALLSVGEENSYGHPKEDTMWRLKNIGAYLFRTDKQGTVTICYDGETLEANQEPCEDWSEGVIPVNPVVAEELEEQDRNNESTEGTLEGCFVINTSSFKFHRPECSAVKKMSEKNTAIEKEATREELIERGYEPCGICNP